MSAQNVHTIELDCKRNASWHQWLLVTADWHWDSVKCDRKLITRHLKQAVERDALVFGIGDIFDAMQGVQDRRSAKSSLRPEHKTDTYFDALVDDLAGWLEPYAANLALLSLGNHETSVIKHHETNLIARLCDKLQTLHGSPVVAGDYQGYVKLMCRAGGGWVKPFQAKYHHGHGGGGIVTKGTLWPLRRSAIFPDCHMVWSGHIHESWYFPIERERVTNEGTVYQDHIGHLVTPGYKDETLAGGGWAIERGMPPKPRGAWWIRLSYNGATADDPVESIRYEAMEAR